MTKVLRHWRRLMCLTTLLLFVAEVVSPGCPFVRVGVPETTTAAHTLKAASKTSTIAHATPDCECDEGFVEAHDDSPASERAPKSDHKNEYQVVGMLHAILPASIGVLPALASERSVTFVHLEFFAPGFRGQLERPPIA